MRDLKIDHLKETALFAHLDKRELELVAEITTEVTVAAGTVLAHEGRPGHEAFIIESGEVSITIGGTTLGKAGPGELVGEMALLLREDRLATLTALTEVELLVIEPGKFDNLLEGVPSVARALVRSLARRLRDTDQMLKH